jgi:hypothetical protein
MAPGERARTTLMPDNSMPQSDLSVPADSFLWNKGTETFEPRPAEAAPRPASARQAQVIDISPMREEERLVPVGMFNQWPLEVLARITKPFTGLVVLIDLIVSQRDSSRNEGLLHSVTGCVAGLLGENDFGCRTAEDEFVTISHGLVGIEAQRRLNLISEQLWQFQQGGHGSYSLLFSWGGLGQTGRPLSEAIQAAVNRMNSINRNRSYLKESVKQHGKAV